ncbi:HDOD domain-containing protein [Nitrospira defluvii]|nr:HDOD domain-containing protein [Nitrospira defluvii]
MDAFIARQPIFDRNQKVFAYELLFRSGLENYFDAPNEAALDQASSKVIGDSILIHGLDTLTAGKKGFYNMSRETLLKEYYAMLPKDQTVVEILENVEPDPEVIAACKKIKESGYALALDDFVDDDRFKPMVALCDIIKVDFLATDPEEQKRLSETYIEKGIKMLAEKVETWEVFQEATEMGYTYFQGYFFSKPTIMTGKDIPGFKLHYLQILQEIQKPELDYRGLEKIIKLEVSLSYKMLRYINSVFFGWTKEIASIHHALVLMGENEVKKWASLMAMAGMADDKADELIIQAIVRAKFCEFLAPKIGLGSRSQDLFLMGMFSLIDAIMDSPLEVILEKLPISSDVKDALLRKEGLLGEAYQLILAYEKGEWEKTSEINVKLRIGDEQVSQFYVDAVNWGSQSFKVS